MELDLFKGKEDTEHTVVGFEELSIIILFEADWALVYVMPFFSSQSGQNEARLATDPCTARGR